jgi:hypothetical protein
MGRIQPQKYLVANYCSFVKVWSDYGTKKDCYPCEYKIMLEEVEISLDLDLRPVS